MGTRVVCHRPDAGECPAYLAVPGGGGSRAPAVVVLEEWWGLNAQIQGVCDRLAAAGYRALAPDLYRGTVAASRDEAAHLMDGLDWADASSEDVAAAVRFLRAQAPGSPVAVLGFCMGGALTLASLARLEGTPDVPDAGVCFYGIPPVELADPARIRRPLLCHFATHDDWCTPQAVHKLESSLQGAVDSGIPVQIHRYDAQHAFFNETGPRHHAPSAAQAWQRTLDFLGRQLGHRPA